MPTSPTPAPSPIDAVTAHSAPCATVDSHLHRNYCALHAAHQDALLHSLRLHVIGGEIAAIAALAALAFALNAQPLILIPVTVALALVLQRALRGMRTAIDYRAQDVNWAQTELLLAEQTLPPAQRTYVAFKLYQDRKPDKQQAAEALFFAPHPASRQQIAEYFFSHHSLSRGRVGALLSALNLVRHTVAAGVVGAALLALV